MCSVGLSGYRTPVRLLQTVCMRVLLLSTNSSASTTTTVGRRLTVGADLAVGSYVVQRIVWTLGRAFDVEAKIVRISRRRLSDPIEVHVEHRMIGGLRFSSRGGRMTIVVSTVTVALLVLTVVVFIPVRGMCGASASGGRCRTTRRELTVSVRALGRAECVFAEHVRGLGRFRAVVVRFGSRMLLIIVIVVVIVITVTIITRASRMEITMICTRGLVVEILVIIPRRCRWRRWWWWCCGGGCRCGGGGGGGGCGRRATR